MQCQIYYKGTTKRGRRGIEDPLNISSHFYFLYFVPSLNYLHICYCQLSNDVDLILLITI